MVKKNQHLSVIGLLSLGYIITIIIGSILLLLPCASKESVKWYDALFTATSATCVTGLVPFPSTNWTMFGQIVILCLIQIGGLGFMTIISLLFILFKKRIGIYNRMVLMQSAGGYTISGVTDLIKRVIIITFSIEGLGSLILSIRFSQDMEIGKAIYYGVFHSISAFCNAGFDIFGNSLIAYKSDYIVLGTIMFLIIMGGLGFIVWSDIIDHGFKFKKYELHSKIVLVFNGLLIMIPAILFFIFEFTNLGNAGKFIDLQLSDKILNALFLSVSPRTAGFNSLPLEELTSSGKLLTIVLMFIGGSPGSTAGGVKVTTIVIVIANAITLAKGNKEVVLFKRKINNNIIKQSSALVLAYLLISISATMFICAVEISESLEKVLFEVVSGIGTVGLSLGLSGTCTIFTKLLLTFLMYIGRLGAFSLFDLIFKTNNKVLLEKPEGKVLVG